MRVLVRDSELLYGYLCDFELFGLFQRYCDMVGYGIKVEGYAEITATADFISRYFLILVYDPDHDNNIFAGVVLVLTKFPSSLLITVLPKMKAKLPVVFTDVSACSANIFAPLLGSRLRLWHP